MKSLRSDSIVPKTTPRQTVLRPNASNKLTGNRDGNWRNGKRKKTDWFSSMNGYWKSWEMSWRIGSASAMRPRIAWMCRNRILSGICNKWSWSWTSKGKSYPAKKMRFYRRRMKSLRSKKRQLLCKLISMRQARIETYSLGKWLLRLPFKFRIEKVIF